MADKSISFYTYYTTYTPNTNAICFSIILVLDLNKSKRKKDAMNILNEYMTNEMNLSQLEQKFVVYRLKCIFYDLSKFIAMYIFFSCIGHSKEYLFACLISAPLRIFSGGLHFKHYASCFAFSFSYFFLIVCGFRFIKMPIYICCILLLVCIIINLFFSPIQSASRPALSVDKIKDLKQKSTIITIYCALITILFYDTKLAPIGYWTILLHSMQLTIAKLLKKGGK